MAWFRQFGRAWRNLGRYVAANPVWAVQAAITSPIRLVRHLLYVLFLFLLAFMVLQVGTEALLWVTGLAKHGWVSSLIMLPLGLLVCLIPLRALFQPMILRFGHADQADTHGAARFATNAEARDLMSDAGLLIGRDRKTGKLLRYPGPAHLLTIAPTRSGKGVGTIVPNLLEYPFAVVCIDPKGENARIAARQRGKFGPVHVLDPFGITGLAPAGYNPLDRIDPTGLDVADDCMTLADALVHDAHNQQTEAHWNEEAKALIAGLLMHVVASEPAASGITFGQQHVGRPLLTPDEVRTLSPDRQLLFLAGQRAVVAAKLRYYADREFAGRYDQA